MKLVPPAARRAAIAAGLLSVTVVLGQLATRPAGEVVDLAKTVRRYVDEVERTAKGYTVHLYFEDLRSEAIIGIRDRLPVLAGSTVKVPIVLFLYHLAAAGLLDLDERIRLTEEDFADTGEERVEPGPFTLRALAVSSLRVSDNAAANALLRRLGRRNVYAFMQGLGAQVLPRGPGMDNVTSAHDAALYLKALLRFQAEHSRFGQEPLAFLYETPFRDRLVAYLPPELRVAHKVGTYRDVAADVGIFFLAGRPYVLSVFVRHPWRSEEDEAGAARIIAEVSYIVYTHMAGLAGNKAGVAGTVGHFGPGAARREARVSSGAPGLAVAATFALLRRPRPPDQPLRSMPFPPVHLVGATWTVARRAARARAAATTGSKRMAGKIITLTSIGAPGPAAASRPLRIPFRRFLPPFSRV